MSKNVLELFHSNAACDLGMPSVISNVLKIDRLCCGQCAAIIWHYIFVVRGLRSCVHWSVYLNLNSSCGMIRSRLRQRRWELNLFRLPLHQRFALFLNQLFGGLCHHHLRMTISDFYLLHFATVSSVAIDKRT